ncbi:MAG: Site-specific DNA methylase [Desulfotomaculum sp. 46_296]|nr:MAG: Site-specific DNA methylase [Desulfotomaculum sp. 46_296]
MEFTVLHLFAGIGGAALGFQQSVAEYKGMIGRFRTLGGVDVDPEACTDFEELTGAPAVEMDLFARSDYEAFHGHEPPNEWTEATAADLLAATGGEHPDVVFLSPPCKGFSGLLPITSRGQGLLREVKRLLGAHGYLFHDGYHDCGEIGGLAQHRKRYLLIARHQEKMSAFVYRPPIRRVRAIGDVLGALPLPDDPAMGLMHRLPRLQWKTWVRLALIPPGGDWRDLDKIAPDQYRLEYVPRDGAFRIGRWNEPATTITGSASVRGSNAMAAIADPRLPHRDNRHPAVYQVVKWDKPGPCVTGTRFGSGAPAVGDPRIGCRPRNGTYKVQAWDQPSATVIGAGDIHAGAAAVADPRIPTDDDRPDPPPVIIALDGTWHRPLTTLELAALQGFPMIMPDGRPLQLAGKSDARWRERIGNAVPPPAARAIGEQILFALMVSAKGELALGSTGVWVKEMMWHGVLDLPLLRAEHV